MYSNRAVNQGFNLGDSEDYVSARLREWKDTHYFARLWKKDTTLWSLEPLPELEDRLGWLDLPHEMLEQADELRLFAQEIHRERTEHVVLLGMGGSSLAPEVYQSTFGNRKDYPQLIVLDSTHPEAVRSVESQIDPGRTLFVVSSKSGTTTETLSFYRYFWARAGESMDEPGPRFVAITDPGTPLEALAKERGFRRVFAAPPDVGGRYSALSVFGLMPAALIGLDIHQILGGARAMADDAALRISDMDNTGITLGAALGELALLGRDKLTITTSESLKGFPAWIEQLVAESTGKDGKGIIPVVDEEIGPPPAYGDDRFFVDITVRGETSENAGRLTALERAGYPVARIQIDDKMLLGREFFRWETAVAAAGSVLGIHPFNQPDVQLAKDLAKKAMSNTSGSGASDGGDDVVTAHSGGGGDLADKIESWLGSARARDYIAIHAYIAPSGESTATLQDLRMALRDRTRLATTLGYGPRFLHSTGQIHKGGPNTGLFLQIVDDAEPAVAVPETSYTFADLIRSQVTGDAQALKQRGRRILRVDLGDGGATGLKELTEIARR